MQISTETITDSQTGETFTIDNRNFNDCVAYQIQYLKDKATSIILEYAPEHKQRNAALGLLSQQETDYIKNIIDSNKQLYKTLENQILAITWDGQESTKTVACDSVQNIIWP